MSADAFGTFEDVGLDNEEEVKKVGRSFRDTVLSLARRKTAYVIWLYFLSSVVVNLEPGSVAASQ